ncbi:MAG TPA: di-heme oxidoredictase family protein [Thermoanaerobaculia bacterium]|jgi:CxxC motif-containing protein (DUF1111 family)|nr:di-heme oxidoredictase family protein [Thermoanaerobaculia bacterium]
MKTFKVLVVLLSWMMVFLPLSLPRIAEGQDSFPPQRPPDAPTGFDNATNGLVDQATHDADRSVFKQNETAAVGLGPTFNGVSCDSCHSIPVTGGISTVTELRAGHLDANGNFVAATAFVNHGTEPIPERSLINLKATCPEAQEQLLPVDNIRVLRLTTNLLGAGFVEAISDATLENIRQGQPADMQGQRIIVPALEGGSGSGRFGWKDQHVSLLSFASDAYLNEIGISNRLVPNRHDFTHQCEDVAQFPDQADPEDVQPGKDDIDVFARFMRATKAPPRDEQLASTAAARRGSDTFTNIGCDTCHVRFIDTAPPGSPMANGDPVPDALGNKRIYPFSDFLLHNIGTGDGIVQTDQQNTRNKVRTAPLWGLRTHQVFLHDGSAATIQDAIQRHGGQAASTVVSFNTTLTSTQQQDLITFLMSL